MKILYAFPEPLPLPRARGVQVAHAVASIAAAGIATVLTYVPVAGAEPLQPIGLKPPDGLSLVPLGRGLPDPLCRVPLFSNLHSVRFYVARLIREIEAHRPDAIYARHPKLVDRLLRYKKLPPIIYEAHEVFADTAGSDRRKRIALIEQNVMRGAAGIVCNSQATADRLTALYSPTASIIVLPNGVAPIQEQGDKDWGCCRQHVIYTGSFFGWKGVADLIAATPELEGFHITLIGGELHQIDRLRRDLPNVGASVEILPRLSHGEVLRQLARACIAVLPNRPDPESTFTSPIKLFEYMASGCAVVASDLPSIREILADDEAVWFEPGNPESLAAALRAVGSDCTRAQALGDRLRAKSATYTWWNRAQRLKTFLESTLA